MRISHEQAFRIEVICRKVFGCDRYGAYGIANADHLEEHPMDAAIAIFSRVNKEADEINEFMDNWFSYFYFECGDDDEKRQFDKVNLFIDELYKLANQYRMSDM